MRIQTCIYTLTHIKLPAEVSYLSAIYRIIKEALINSAVRGEVLSLTKGRTMNAKYCKIIMLYGSPFDKLRANGINRSFLRIRTKWPSSCAT